MPENSANGASADGASAANFEVALRLRELAGYLEILGENAFKVRAYRTAAQTLETISEPIEQVAAEQRLDELAGFGAAISAKTRDILSTGTTKALEDARRKLPSTILELLELPGIGPKTVKQLHESAGIASAAALESALAEQRLRSLPGFSEKTEAKLREALDRRSRYAGSILISEAREIAEFNAARLRGPTDAITVDVAGSVRRGAQTASEIVLVAASADPAALIEHFVSNPQAAEVLVRDTHSAAVRMHNGIPVRLEVTDAASFGALICRATGSASHVRRLDEIARELGVAFDGDGLRDQSGHKIAGADEAGIYRALGLDPIPPPLREDRGEIEAARAHSLPRLVRTLDIMGDVHAHTTASDGRSSIEEMALAARARGYAYCAITDHSRSLTIARGLSIETLKAQVVNVRAASDRLGFAILPGTECDILADGSMDFPDDVLAGLDFVIGSVHSRFRQTRQEMTARLIRAIENPHVDLIAHPTGRLLNQRDPYDADWEAVFAAAARTGTALEINSFPDRQDLSDELARAARDAGARLMIDTDAHAPEHYALIEYGVCVAQRAWIGPESVLNTLALSDFVAWTRR